MLRVLAYLGSSKHHFSETIAVFPVEVAISLRLLQLFPQLPLLILQLGNLFVSLLFLFLLSLPKSCRRAGISHPFLVC
jgi:hypothetical protein